jgi:hypothetical protein
MSMPNQSNIADVRTIEEFQRGLLDIFLAQTAAENIKSKQKYYAFVTGEAICPVDA